MNPKNKAGIRAFIALNLPQHVRQALIDTQNQLKHKVDRGSVRWAAEKGFHLTLFFLGDGISPAQIEKLCQLIDDLANNTRPFTLALENLGCFPNIRRPKVLWTGLQGELDALLSLKKQVDHHLLDLGWQGEKRPYHPHLTLGRVKDQMGVVNSDLPYGQTLAEADWTVNSLTLYRSQLNRKRGAIYTKIHTSLLGN